MGHTSSNEEEEEEEEEEEDEDEDDDDDEASSFGTNEVEADGMEPTAGSLSSSIG